MSALEDISLFSAVSSLPNISTPVGDSLKSVKDESKSVVAVIRHNLEILTKRIHWMCLSYQDLNPERNQKELQILKAFQDTVGNSVEELGEYLIEQQEQQIEEMLLFQNAFIEKVLAVLSNTLEFEKRLSSIAPDVNDRMMNIIGNLLIALLATYSPLLAIVVEGSGILDHVKSVCSESNISKQIEKWQEKVQHIQEHLQVIAENRKFRDQSKSVKLVTAIAEVAEVSPISVAVLGLGVKNLEEINRAITKRPEYVKEIRILVNLSEEMQLTSQNISTSRRIVTSIQNRILEYLEHLPEGLKNKEATLQDLTITGLQEVQGYMEGAVSSDKGVIEKLDLCYKVVSAVHKMTKRIDEETGAADVSEVLVGLVKDHTHGVIPKKFWESVSSPTLPLLNETFRTSRVVQAYLEVVGVQTGPRIIT